MWGLTVSLPGDADADAEADTDTDPAADADPRPENPSCIRFGGPLPA